MPYDPERPPTRERNRAKRAHLRPSRDSVRALEEMRAILRSAERVVLRPSSARPRRSPARSDAN
eukprot:12297855-Alexandrium_andersonii.AAC.1